MEATTLEPSTAPPGVDDAGLLDRVAAATRDGVLTLSMLALALDVAPDDPRWEDLAQWLPTLDGTTHPDGGVLRYEAVHGRLCRHDDPAETDPCRRPGQGEFAPEDLYLRSDHRRNRPTTTSPGAQPAA